MKRHVHSSREMPGSTVDTISGTVPGALASISLIFYVNMENRILKPVLVLSVVPKAPQIELHSFILCCVLKRSC